MTAATRMPPVAAGFAAAEAELRTLFGERLTRSGPVCAQHTNTTTWMTGGPPDAVAFPRGAAEVRDAVRLCARHAVPVIPFGAGTSFEGHVNAPFGGLCLDMSEMNRVLAVRAEDFTCTVEPGVTRLQLDAALRGEGLFFPVDPGADASLGGMVSTGASGTTAVRYGTMRENVLALKVVLPSGEEIATARRARKSSAGYDITRLFVGAEGTLGVITEATLRLHGLPEVVSAGICRFPSIEAACDAAILAIQAGIPVARVELLDEVQIRVCNAHSRLDLPEAPHLFLEFHGTEAGVAEQAERFGEIVRDEGGSDFDWAVRAEDRSRLWRARHDVFWASKSYRPGSEVIVTDVCVPISRLAECIEATKRDLEASGLVAPIVGHAGDGNFHAQILLRMEDADEVTRSKAFLERLAERAIAFDGTCTGEHGIGEGKKRFLEREHGEGAVALMATLKRAIDPGGIMNPGKIV